MASIYQLDNSYLFGYKGYKAVCEFSEEDRLYVGTVFNIKDVVAFHGKTIEEAEEHFENIIEEYEQMKNEISTSRDS